METFDKLEFTTLLGNNQFYRKFPCLGRRHLHEDVLKYVNSHRLHLAYDFKSLEDLVLELFPNGLNLDIVEDVTDKSIS